MAKILIVDDNATNRKLLVALLSKPLTFEDMTARLSQSCTT